MKISNTFLEDIQLLNKGELTDKLLKYVLKKINDIDSSRIDLLDEYYKNNKSILRKQRLSKTAPNNYILSNYARYITEVNVGYFMSTPINYNVNDSVDIQNILDIYTQNNILNVDKQNAKLLSKFGKCYELVFIDENTNIKSKSIAPTNALLFRENTLLEKEVLGIYFTEEVIDETRFKTIYLYTDQAEMIIEVDGEAYNIISFRNHFFKQIPLIEMKNNEEMLGDYETVLTLIDAYNKIISNDIDNIEEFIDSILVFYGADNLNEEQINLLKQTRGLSLDKEAKAEYLLKTLDETGITVALDRIRKDIHKFSFTPDISDEQFAGNSSGIALAYKLLPFELLTKTKEAEYEKAVRKRFELYNIYCAILMNSQLVPNEEVEVVFSRGLPKNDLEVADMITKLQGMITNKTLISNLSFIKNANEEDELLKEENKLAQEEMQNSMKSLGGFNSDEGIEELNEEER